MATSSSTSSRIELTKLPPDEEVTPPSLDPYGVTDNVFVASQLADASVPDGGYGWVVVFSCGVITFWFIGSELISWALPGDQSSLTDGAFRISELFLGNRPGRTFGRRAVDALNPLVCGIVDGVVYLRLCSS